MTCGNPRPMYAGFITLTIELLILFGCASQHKAPPHGHPVVVSCPRCAFHFVSNEKVVACSSSVKTNCLIEFKFKEKTQ
jgi:hypothetical protein